ncbi:hypothetical protein LPW26_11855 [Rhodopseudomonas sp. HC1]|uniref:hypothetical protein n=1 Tax=Rhodopseudomonas infernalis TaxID=2897386 RepID=UPI001EE8E427|nr:hypothetical protein [Rhodopseudomonas infernalis]MCG6205337.1 hypothetical protein [Rhodopseudomonas infernalis]
MMTQTLETTDVKEARRSRIAQFSGRAATIKVGGSSITGIVRAVKEDKSGNTPRWLVTVVEKPRTA